jgi:FixJ family two-component response regulator
MLSSHQIPSDDPRHQSPTTFMPNRPPSEFSTSPTNVKAASASTAPDAPAPADAAPPVVFVVDDDASVRRSLTRLVRAAGYEAEPFASAAAFLKAAPSARPGCMLLDARMPDMTGLDLQQELARQGRPVPIVFLTGHGDVPMAARAMKGGAVDFLLKPFKDVDLLDAIGRAVARARADFASRAEQERIFNLLRSLTPRERQVLHGVVSGRLNKQIAYDLGVTEATIKLHRGRVMEKMAVESLAELVHLVDRVGGVPVAPTSAASESA